MSEAYDLDRPIPYSLRLPVAAPAPAPGVAYCAAYDADKAAAAELAAAKAELLAHVGEQTKVACEYPAGRQRTISISPPADKVEQVPDLKACAAQLSELRAHLLTAREALAIVSSYVMGAPAQRRAAKAATSAITAAQALCEMPTTEKRTMRSATVRVGG